MPYYQAAGRDALAQISYQWQARLPGWTIVFKPEKSGYRGLTLVREKRVEVYVRRNPGSVSTAHVLAHEIGHAVDVSRLNSADRAQWLAGRGLQPSTRWFPNSGAEDFASGAGDFAEAFANWQIGTPTNSRLAGQPTAAQRALVAQLSN